MSGEKKITCVRDGYMIINDEDEYGFNRYAYIIQIDTAMT